MSSRRYAAVVRVIGVTYLQAHGILAAADGQAPSRRCG
jgi:hypothetical protein